MGNAFGMIPGLEPDEWSNDACRGYVIMAMENCGFSKKDIPVSYTHLDVYKRQGLHDNKLFLGHGI